MLSIYISLSLLQRYRSHVQALVRRRCIASFKALFRSSVAPRITIARNEQPKPKPDPATLVFGKEFTDHMLTVKWDASRGWDSPQIVPFGNLSLSPATSALHYATECIEGMKAYRGIDGKVRLFRPLENIRRLNKSAAAVCLPEFNEAELLECIQHLVHTDRDWVPEAKDCSLYIRPTFIG
eukprot:Em0010g297a